MSLDSTKTVLEIVKGLLESVAILAAAWWFFRQSQAKRRIQFDIDCAFTLSTVAGTFAEIRFEFENKGFVEHRLYDLTVSVHGLSPESAAGTNAAEPEFSVRLFPNKKIVPEKYGFYFVRPGVRQVITHLAFLRDPGPIIRITAGFNYTKDGSYPHTARRVFHVPSAMSAERPSA